jgi:aryl-alcohol dehydrogenase-like predicted oxidoreductase
MHFGETLDEQRYLDSIRVAYESGIRTFVTADVYGQGKADEALGAALAGYPRDSYCLVGMLGHDFYEGTRNGSAGYQRFTDPALRTPAEFHSFLRMACERSLTNCRTDHFDLVMLHNPDEAGYTSEDVWKAMDGLKAEGLTQQLGVAPGPANGFTLDIIKSFELFGETIDWAMIILNPLEPWPGQHVLPAAAKHDVKILTRVVDYGGIFHDDLKSPDRLAPGDHRAYRPAGWIEAGNERMERMRPIAEKHGLSMLHFSCIWNLSQPMVRSVVPTIIQEAGDDARPIEDKIREYAALPDVTLSPEEVEEVRSLGDNTGCMMLKGASRRHEASERPDEWPMRPDLLEVAARYALGPEW